MEWKRRFAPGSRRAESGRGPVLTATVKHPDATPACTPKGAFSMMMVLDCVIGAMCSLFVRKCTLAFSIPMRYGSGFGFPYFTSKAVTMRSGWNMSGKFSWRRSRSDFCPEPVTTIGVMPDCLTLQSSS